MARRAHPVADLGLLRSLQDDDRDDSGRLSLIVGKLWEELCLASVESVAVCPTGDGRSRRVPFRADFDRHHRVGHQVVVPVGVSRRTAVGCEYREPVAVAQVHDRRRVGLVALRANRGEKQQRPPRLLAADDSSVGPELLDNAPIALARVLHLLLLSCPCRLDLGADTEWTCTARRGSLGQGSSGLGGMMSARATYRRTSSASIGGRNMLTMTQTTRAIVGSTPMYSAIPPTTPASMRFFRERYRRRAGPPSGCTRRPPAYCDPSHRVLRRRSFSTLPLRQPAVKRPMCGDRQILYTPRCGAMTSKPRVILTVSPEALARADG